MLGSLWILHLEKMILFQCHRILGAICAYVILMAKPLSNDFVQLSEANPYEKS